MKKIVVALMLLQAFVGFSQEKFEIKKIGFSMDFPKDWFSFSDKEMMDNLDKYDFDEKQMDNFIKSHQESVNFATFTKFDPKKVSGIIPTIKILMRSNPTKNSTEFLEYVNRMNEGAKAQLDQFAVAQKPVLVKIAGNDAVKTGYTFTLNIKKEYIKIRCGTFYIPRGSYFLTLNFIEAIDKEDNSAIFESLFDSIKLTNL